MKPSNITRTLRWLVTLAGMVLSLAAVGIMLSIMQSSGMVSREAIDNAQAYIFYGAAIISGIIFFIFAPVIIERSASMIMRIENSLKQVEFSRVFSGTIGLIAGLIIANLITRLFTDLSSALALTLSLIVYGILAYLGVTVSISHWPDMLAMLQTRREMRRDSAKNYLSKPKEAPKKHYDEYSGGKPGRSPGQMKILDTSVIIDGRIFDVCKTGFVEGALVVPEFVLAELRHIADSSDKLRRNRGRRGLDILAKIQKELEIPLIIDETDFNDTNDVDVKLLKLAQEYNGIVVTTDYNLNKVAGVTGINVLNINELANAIKPIFMPGEEMHVYIVREGKEAGQGIAYLDDGTMIVVDNGKRLVGETVDVEVTTVLQTSAGRMIFTKIKSMGKAV